MRSKGNGGERPEACAAKNSALVIPPRHATCLWHLCCACIEHSVNRAWHRKLLSFALGSIALDAKVTLKPAPEATLDQKLKWEKDLLGIYLSSHPFAFYESQMKGKLTMLADVEHAARDMWVVSGGVVAALKKKITKK